VTGEPVASAAGLPILSFGKMDIGIAMNYVSLPREMNCCWFLILIISFHVVKVAPGKRVICAYFAKGATAPRGQRRKAMEWYKHSTGSHDDPDISDAIDEFGLAGYSTFFIALEIYGQEFNHLDDDGWLTLSRRFFARKLRISQAKVELLLNFYSERQRILLKASQNSISIKCPKFVDIASNWTKRKQALPTETLQSTSVVPTAKEEEEKKNIKEKNIKKRKTPIPDDFEISDRVKLWAEKKKMNHLQEHLESFVISCRAKGYEYVDWDSAFMNAIRQNWARLEGMQKRSDPFKA
jgi:hypothetical protein